MSCYEEGDGEIGSELKCLKFILMRACLVQRFGVGPCWTTRQSLGFSILGILDTLDHFRHLREVF